MAQAMKKAGLDVTAEPDSKSADKIVGHAEPSRGKPAPSGSRTDEAKSELLAKLTKLDQVVEQ